MLMKLTPVVNFINILHAAFKRASPKSAKNIVKLSVFLLLLGSVSAKAACRTFMKLTPGRCKMKNFQFLQQIEGDSKGGNL